MLFTLFFVLILCNLTILAETAQKACPCREDTCSAPAHTPVHRPGRIADGLHRLPPAAN